MSTSPGATADALAAIYGQVTELAQSLTDATAMLQSRCSGWAVTDVLYHELMDARRALVTFATPSPEPPDTDEVSYWLPFSASAGGPASPGSEGPARHAHFVRVAASAYPTVDLLAAGWEETSAAAVRAALACRHHTVATQGHRLALSDFISTLVVEATVHYLDMTVAFPAAPPPEAGALTIVCRVLEGLAATTLPPNWDDEECALKATGRLPLTAGDYEALGPLARKLPLLG